MIASPKARVNLYTSEMAASKLLKYAKLFNYVVIVCIFAIILWKFLYGLSQTRYSADDYCFDSLVGRSGFLGATEYLLKNSGPYFFAYAIQLGVVSLGVKPGIYLTILFLIFVFSVQLLLKRLLINQEKTTIRLGIFTFFLALTLISTFLTIPNNGPGAFALTTLGWSAGTSRLIALILFLFLFSEVLKSKPNFWTIGLIVFLISGSDFSMAVSASAALFLLWVYKSITRLSNAEKNLRFLLLSVISLVFNLSLTQTEGSKNRVLALNEGMRQGESIQFDSQLIQTAKYNAFRLVMESISLRAILIALAIGIVMSLMQSFITERSFTTPAEQLKVLTVFILVTIAIGVFTWLGSVIAYLQTWHFISYVFFFYFTVSLVARFVGSIALQMEYGAQFFRISNLLLSVLIVLIGLVAVFEVEKFSLEIKQRAELVDNREDRGTLDDIPIRDFKNNPLTEDLKSEWVKNCYLSSADSSLRI